MLSFLRIARWPWGIWLHVGDEHPFSTYVDVHHRYRVLTHRCDFSEWKHVLSSQIGDHGANKLFLLQKSGTTSGKEPRSQGAWSPRTHFVLFSRPLNSGGVQ